MNFNIDFTFLYLADIAENFSNLLWLFVPLFIVGMVITIVNAGIIWSEEAEGDELKMLKTFLKIGIITMIVSFIVMFLNIFIPSKETIYSIGIGNNIVNNQTEIVDTIEGAVDYIVDAADKLINGKSETGEKAGE